jgi:hypothetical protein
MKLSAISLALLIFLAVPVRTALSAGDWPQDSAPLHLWATVLQTYVDDEGRVDFAGLAENPEALQGYLDYVGEVSPESHPERFPSRESALAHYINAYNALAIYNVIDSGIPKSIGGLRKFHFFFIKRLKFGGKRISLYHLENDLIRPLGEERVHFALNCMAVSCPRLPREPFTADGLDQELEREAERFFAEKRNLEVQPEKRRLRVAEILDFYTEDFTAKSGTLVAYINRYHDGSIPEDFEVRFFDYDWTVNRQP